MPEETRYGHLMDHWQAARDEMRQILIACARQRQTITYGELSARMQTVHLPPHSYAMSGMLREIIDEDHRDERGILATLVVRKSDGRPGPGYFKSAIDRGLSHDDLEAYWQTEFEKVCAYWSQSHHDKG